MQRLFRASKESPITALTVVFASWKLFLLGIAFTTTGVGYDTSSSLLDVGEKHEYLATPNTLHPILKLARWDAIYFTALAHRGHYFEQEWAFGKGISTLVSLLAGSHSTFLTKVYTAVILSHVSHYVSVIILYKLAQLVFGETDARREIVGRRAFVTASLHIISPGGLFLSAPCAESTFSMFNMLGFWLYAKGHQLGPLTTSTRHAIMTIVAGVAFGIACTMRGNGILSGIPFLVDAVILTWQLFQGADTQRTGALMRSLSVTIIAGLCVGVGFLLPQGIAYLEYCVDRETRQPWCNMTLPLIFSYVQAHYWNNGFLRYWTVSNIPLFLLAGPCLGLLGQSSIDAFRESKGHSRRSLMLRLALPQLVLVVLAIFNFHIQIITRLSSGYPWWYIWLAERLGSAKKASYWVQFMVIYGVVQGVLFASFLPPA